MPRVTNSAGVAVAAPSTTARPSAAHHVLIAVLFLVAMAGTCGLLHSRLPFPSVPDIAPRFRYFAEHKDEFDTIFIGSSRVRHGIIPETFDAEMAMHSLHTHSFNLGYSGMWPPESDYYLRQVLALHPKKLRFVFIELMDYRFGQAEGEAPTMRSVYWHDVAHTGMALRLVAESPLPFSEKLGLWATHVHEFVQAMTNPGRGAEWVEERYFPVKKKLDTSWIARRGFDPEPATEWSESAKAEYRRQIDAFQQARQRETPARPGLVSAVQRLSLEVSRTNARSAHLSPANLLDISEVRTVHAIFIVPPTVRPEEHFPATTTLRLSEDFAFDDPTRFPRLYLPELHYDPGHLNADGAGEFTRLLADRLAAMMPKH